MFKKIKLVLICYSKTFALPLYEVNSNNHCHDAV